MKLALNLLEYLRLDEPRHRNRYDLFIGLALPRTGRGFVEFPLSDVDRVSQNLVD
jgi:hypothetical protein